MNVYDFDNTIYSGDSTIDFYKFCIKHHPNLLVYLPVQIISAILYKLKIIDLDHFKSDFFIFMRRIKSYDEEVEAFWDKYRSNIQKWYLDQKKSSDVIISASPTFLLERIARDLQVDKLIATSVNPKTGKLEGRNCKGEEKVKRFTEEYPNVIIDNFYSDSRSDDPIARLSKQAFLVKDNKIIDWE